MPGLALEKVLSERIMEADPGQITSENVPGVNLQTYALADDTENCLPGDIVISPSFRLLSSLAAPSYRTVWSSL